MPRRLISRLTYSNVVSTIGAFALLAGGTAYAADTIGSSDIIDGQVKAADIGNGEVGSADVKDNSINTFDVHSFLGTDVVDGSLTGDDIGDGTLTGFDIRDGFIGQVELADTAVNSAKVADNSLTGADIDESTLNLAPVSTTTFGGPSGVLFTNGDGTPLTVMQRTVPAGSWAVTATVNSSAGTEAHSGDVTRELSCSLRAPDDGFLGGATDRRTIPGGQIARRTLTMTGGFQAADSSRTVRVWCSSQGSERIDYGSMMLIRVGGFS